MISPEIGNPAPRASAGTGIGNTSLLGDFDGFEPTKTIPAVQDESFDPPLSFFELVFENSECHLWRLDALAAAAIFHGKADDLEGYLDSIGKLIAETNSIASLARPLKKHSILSHEEADRYEREAETLRNRIYILERHASDLREGASIGDGR
jgi:hypothetical protein